MELTAEELAVYGVIDAETYIELSDALIAGINTIRDCFPKLDARTCAQIRARAGDVLGQRWADTGAAVVLQRCVADELDRQIERLDILTTRCQEGK